MSDHDDDEVPLVGTFTSNDEKTLEAWEVLSHTYGWPRPDYDPKALQGFGAAMAAFQGSVEQIRKDKKAMAGSYSYAYADLGGILATVRPALAANGLAVMQALGNANDGRPTITTTLMHEGGHSERSTFAFPAQTDAQRLGSWVSYIRRYALCAMLGVVAEDDDDGAYASQPPPARAAKKAPAKAPAKAPSNGEITAPQVKALSAAATAAGLTDEDVAAIMREQYGLADGSRKGLRKDQASKLIESLTTLVDEPPDSPRWEKLNEVIGNGLLF